LAASVPSAVYKQEHPPGRLRSLSTGVIAAPIVGLIRICPFAFKVEGGRSKLQGMLETRQIKLVLSITCAKGKSFAECDRDFSLDR
jgi:hypothetical protein